MRLFPLLPILVTLVSCTSDSPTSAQAETPVDQPPIPAHYQSEREAQPLTPTLSAKLFSDPKMARIYDIAQRIPAILAQQPCYCYCDRGHGHRSLLDCQRDNHSASCAVCRKEVLLADRLSRMGLNAKEIRASIIRGDWKQVAE
ncbi:MAG: CYCXC family (seleno)protein [Bryobacteraceae bacterium]